MEKCTYCVQRIERAAHRRAASAGGRSRDGEVVTACQQACPTEAIVFGTSPTRERRGGEAARATRAATTCSTSSAPGRAPPTWRGSATPTRSWHEHRAPTAPSRRSARAAPLLLGAPRRPSPQRRAALGHVWTPHAQGLVDRLLRARCALGHGLLGRRPSPVTVCTGIGLWGNNIPVAWAFGIINFVWWIGIGHAGTFISAILLLLEQKWRTCINRFAEAMTLFAVMQARALPAPAPGPPLVRRTGSSRIRPRCASGRNFKSPLPWDVVAVSTYFTVSLLFWYLGPHPRPRRRCATPRRAQARRIVYGDPRARLARLGAALAALPDRPTCSWPASPRRSCSRCTPSSASTSPSRCSPGWHSTIFPPYFVAGAIFSGFAMVVTLIIPARKVFRLRERRHRAAPGQHGQDDCSPPADRRLRLPHRVLHRLVLRQPLRDPHFFQPAPPVRTPLVYWPA